MSDTPRTDKAIVEANDWTPPNVFSLCQQLERELAAVKAKSEERRAVLERNEFCVPVEDTECYLSKCPECDCTGLHHQTCVWAKAMRD